MVQLTTFKNESGEGMNTKRLVTLSVFLSISIVLSILESFIPAIPIPGAKLGLANIMTLVVLSTYGRKDAFALIILRIILVGFLRGSLGSPSFFFSLSGGLVAYSFMAIFIEFKRFSLITVSIMGAIGHSIGQIGMAIIILSTPQLVLYLPWILLIAIVTGVFNGLVAMKFIVITKTAQLT